MLANKYKRKKQQDREDWDWEVGGENGKCVSIKLGG